jgi:hypothetical protein
MFHHAGGLKALSMVLLDMAGEVALGESLDAELALHSRLLGAQLLGDEEIKLGSTTIVSVPHVLPPVTVLSAAWHTLPGQVPSHAMEFKYYSLTYLSLECTTPIHHWST